MSDAVDVLHVDDDGSFVDLSATFLEREVEQLAVETATSAEEGLDRLTGATDCVVSDYDMPDRDGIAFLEAVRERDPELPFILFTGKGSEEIAAEALSAGATDYLQKETGTSQYAVLANRIENAVAQHRARLRSRRADRRRRQTLERITDGYVAMDEEFVITDVNEQAAEFLDHSREEVLGTPYRELTFRDDPAAVLEAYVDVIERREPETLVARSDVRSGRWVEERIFPAEHGIFVYFRDVTERKRRERELQRERDRFVTLFENLPDPVARIRLDDGEPIIREVNGAFEETFGYAEDELVGGSVDEFIVPDDRLEEAQSMNDRLVRDQEFEARVERLTPDGLRPFVLRTVVQESVGGGFSGYAIYTDTTASG